MIDQQVVNILLNVVGQYKIRLFERFLNFWRNNSRICNV